MPVLAQLIITIVTFLVSLFGRFMVVEKAFRISAVGMMVVFIGVMVAVMNSCTSGVCAQGISSMSGAHPGFAVGLSLAVNGTTIAAMGAYMSVWLACQLYVVQKKGLNILTK